MQIFRDSTRKRRSLDSKIQALTAKETTSKAHMQVHTNKESREKQAWRKSVPNWAETGLGQPAWADRPSPFQTRFGAPFDLAASRAIYAPLVESHGGIHSSSAAKEQKEKDTILERRGSRWLTRAPLAGIWVFSSSIYPAGRFHRMFFYPWWLEVHTRSTKRFQLVLLEPAE
jgi:hypothetical protein